jgi:hypothetical protein
MFLRNVGLFSTKTEVLITTAVRTSDSIQLLCIQRNVRHGDFGPHPTLSIEPGRNLPRHETVGHTQRCLRQ